MRLSPSILQGLTALLLLSGLTGCKSLRTDKTIYAGTEDMLRRGDVPAVIQKIEGAKEKGYQRKDRVVYYLDTGMLYHFNSDWTQSNEKLEQAERAIEETYTRSLSRSAASLIFNDNLLEYDGEPYEDVYLNVFKALNYLALAQNDEAFVELRRSNLKLQQLEDKYYKMGQKLDEANAIDKPFRPGKSRFQNSTLARYLSLLLYRNEGKWDDVRIDLEKIERAWKLQPDMYPFSAPDFKEESNRNVYPNARLNLFAFAGLSPDKKSNTLYIHSEENLLVIAGTVEGDTGYQSLSNLNMIYWPNISAGYHFKFQLPSMHRRPSEVDRITAEVVGQEKEYDLYRLESLENVAFETFKLQQPMIYLKTIARAVTKGLAAEQAKAKMTEGMDDLGGFLVRIVADLAVDATENADLRISRFFPAESYIRELHLPEGTHSLNIHYYNRSNQRIHTSQHPDVKLEAGKLNVLQSAYLN